MLVGAKGAGEERASDMMINGADVGGDTEMGDGSGSGSVILK